MAYEFAMHACVAVAKGYIITRVQTEYLYIQVRTRCHMQMFWQVRAHPAHACTCAKRYLHYTAPSLLVFHVGSIAIRRVSVSYWVPWLNVYFLRWRGGQLPGLVLLPLARHHSCPAALHVFLLVDYQFESRAL